MKFKRIIFIFSIILAVLVGYIFYEVSLSSRYYKLVKSECEKYGLNSITVISLIKTESNFNKNAKSTKNAKGLMQIKDQTAKYVSELYNIEYDDLFDYKSNVKLGVAYLDYLTKKFKYEDVVLCAYNAGESVVNSWKEKGYIKNDDINYIPYKETKNYLTKIKKLKNFYTIFY